MIKSKADYHNFLAADLKSHQLDGFRPARWRPWDGFQYPTLWFQRVLRRTEYINNVDTLTHRILRAPAKAYFRMLSVIFGFTIPLNTCDSGLTIPHWGNIVVNSEAVLGKNCKIHVGVNIGMKDYKCPVIGNNVYLGPGAKLFGDIVIGDSVTIGANAVVTKSLPQGVVAAGIPARVLSHKES